MTKPTGPRRPDCGSADMTVGGFVTFHWRNGRLVPRRGSEEIADGAPFTCNACGQALIGNYEPPFEFVKDSATFV